MVGKFEIRKRVEGGYRAMLIDGNHYVYLDFDDNIEPMIEHPSFIERTYQALEAELGKEG